jgi:hypothetical protein
MDFLSGKIGKRTIQLRPRTENPDCIEGGLKLALFFA